MNAFVLDGMGPRSRKRRHRRPKDERDPKKIKAGPTETSAEHADDEVVAAAATATISTVAATATATISTVAATATTTISTVAVTATTTTSTVSRTVSVFVK